MTDREIVPGVGPDDEFLFARLIEALHRSGFKLDEAYSAARFSFWELKPVLLKILMKEGADASGPQI